MADNEKHYFANDGTDWTTPPSPVSSDEAREADLAYDEEAAHGQGPSATNETRLGRTSLEDSASKQ